MDIRQIIEAIEAGRVNITQHARREAREDRLLMDVVLSAASRGGIIEDYPKDSPYPSCLIHGVAETGDIVHGV